MNKQTIPSLSKVINRTCKTGIQTISTDRNRHAHQEQLCKQKQTVKMKLTQTNNNAVPHPIVHKHVKELTMPKVDSSVKVS